MKNKKNRVQRFVKQDSICNICKQNKSLSEDHVPPKVCPPVKDRVVDLLLPKMIGYKGFQGRFSQNGVSYTTICRDCNTKLGINYDAKLGEFSRNIQSFVESQIHLPDTFDIECYPNAIMRSILGHILAAKTVTDSVVIDDLIRPCILDSSLPIPNDIHIFYWVYPYEEIVILRDFVVMDLSNPPATFNLIKFYPVAFLVTHQLTEYQGLLNLDSFNNISPSDKAKIKIDLRQRKNATWPESNGFACGRAIHDAVLSSPKPEKKKRKK